MSSVRVFYIKTAYHRRRARNISKIVAKQKIALLGCVSIALKHFCQNNNNVVCSIKILKVFFPKVKKARSRVRDLVYAECPVGRLTHHSQVCDPGRPTD